MTLNRDKYPQTVLASFRGFEKAVYAISELLVYNSQGLPLHRTLPALFFRKAEEMVEQNKDEDPKDLLDISKIHPDITACFLRCETEEKYLQEIKKAIDNQLAPIVLLDVPFENKSTGQHNARKLAVIITSYLLDSQKNFKLTIEGRYDKASVDAKEIYQYARKLKTKDKNETTSGILILDSIKRIKNYSDTTIRDRITALEKEGMQTPIVAAQLNALALFSYFLRRASEDRDFPLYILIEEWNKQNSTYKIFDEPVKNGDLVSLILDMEKLKNGLKKRGYRVEGGLCFGIGLAGMQEMDKIEVFFKRLNLLSLIPEEKLNTILENAKLKRMRLQGQKEIKLSEEETLLLSLPAFLEGIHVYQDVSLYPQLFEEEYRPYNQNAPLTLPRLLPFELVRREEKDGFDKDKRPIKYIEEIPQLEQVSFFNGLYDTQDLTTIFENLRKCFLLANLQTPCGFFIYHGIHALSLVWLPKTQTWVLIEGNSLWLKQSELEITEIPVLVDNIKRLLFCRESALAPIIEIYTRSNQAKKLKDALEACQAQKDWQAIQSPRKSLAKGQDLINWLCIAAQCGDIQTVTELLKHKPNLNQDYRLTVNQEMLSFGTPLCIAAQYGFLNIVELFITKGADVNRFSGMANLTPLRAAAARNQHQVVVFLLAAKADVNQVKKGTCSALYAAAQEGHIKIVQTLIRAGAIIDQKCINDFTPLCVAAGNGHVEVVKYLLFCKANINHTAINGFTSLHVAVDYGCFDIVKLLIMNDADVNKSSKEGITPLYLAAHNGQYEMVDFLLTHNANADQANKNNVTPLSMATQKGYLNIVERIRLQKDRNTHCSINADIKSDVNLHKRKDQPIILKEENPKKIKQTHEKCTERITSLIKSLSALFKTISDQQKEKEEDVTLSGTSANMKF